MERERGRERESEGSIQFAAGLSPNGRLQDDVSSDRPDIKSATK